MDIPVIANPSGPPNKPTILEPNPSNPLPTEARAPLDAAPAAAPAPPIRLRVILLALVVVTIAAGTGVHPEAPLPVFA